MTPPTNVLPLGQRLAEALGAAHALIRETPGDLTARIEELRHWSYAQPPAEFDRLLWRRFALARQTHAEITHAIAAAREALDRERRALTRAQADLEALAAQPLPATIEQEAQAPQALAVRRYQALRVECQEREAAIAAIERMLPAPEHALEQATEAVVGLLEAVITLDRGAQVRRLSAELEAVRAWFERLGTAGDAHAGEIDEWSQRGRRPVRVPRIAFSWPPAAAWRALLDAAVTVEAPRLVWDDDDPARPSARGNKARAGRD